MQIWTTPHLNDLLLEKALPVKLAPEGEIKDVFLVNSAPGDIALLGIDEDYLEFLEAAQAQGIAGPILFISPEPTIVKDDLYRSNAVMLDLKTMGTAGVKNIVHVVLNLAVKQTCSGSADIVTEQKGAGKADEKSIEDADTIKNMLSYGIKHTLPVMVAFEIKEEGEPVTARGICNIKELRGDTAVLHRFRQSLMFRGMKKSMSVKLYFSYKQNNMETFLTIREVHDQEVIAAVPERLFTTKGMRIQPNPKRPVNLFVLIPNEPTTNFKVVDISPRGIGFLCPRDLPIDSVYKFTIVLPEPQTIVLTRGVIRFKKEQGNVFRYGAEISPHPWDEENIAKYVMTREAEIIGLLRNL